MDINTKLDNCYPYKSKRYIAIVLSVIEMFLFGGYHYGFNSLIHIYKSRGLFSYNCTQSDHCMFHDYWYGISFHIWLVSEMCLLIFTGLFMDHIGLRALKFVSTLIYAIGTILFAITTGSTPILFILAGILVDLGCISNLMCNQQISLMFPYLRGLCIALLSGAFDSSTVISYIISIIHPYISLYWSLICLAIGSLSMGLFLALFIMTTKSVDMLKYAVISRDSQMIIQSRENCLEEPLSPDFHQELSNLIHERYPTIRSCLLSLPFCLINLWFGLGLLRFSMYLNHLSSVLNYLFPSNDEDIVNKLLKVSSVFFMCGFLMAPLTGTLIDLSLKISSRYASKLMLSNSNNEEGGSDRLLIKTKVYYTYLSGLLLPFILMGIFTILLSSMFFIHNNTITVYASFIFLVIVRGLLYSPCISFLLIAFPVRYFGTLNGITSILTGLFSLLQHTLIYVDVSIINIISLIISICIFIPCIVLFKLKG